MFKWYSGRDFLNMKIRTCFILPMFLIAGMGLGFFSCKKDYWNDYSRNSRNKLWAFQIAEGFLNFEDIASLRHDSLQSLLNNTITFVSDTNFQTGFAPAYIQVPDANKSLTFNLSPADTTTLGGTGTLVKTFSDTLSFPFPSTDSIKIIKVKTGNINITASHGFPHHGKVRVVFPEIKLGSTPLSAGLTLTYSGTTPVTTVLDLPLDGYTISPGNGSGLPFNFIRFQVTDTLTDSGSPHSVTLPGAITVTITGITFNEISGSFPSMVIPVSQILQDIPLFQAAVSGQAEFLQPKIILTGRNYFGMPLKFLFPSVSGLDGTAPVSLISDSLSNGFLLKFPTAKGQYAQTTLNLLPSNTNLPEFLNVSPRQIDWNISAAAQPVAGNFNYFATDTSYASLKTEVQLPLSGKFSSFTLQDTLPVDFSSFAQHPFDTLRLWLQNGFPIDAGLQIYFLDAGGLLLDSLFHNSLFTVNAAAVGNNGTVISKSISMHQAPVSISQFDHMLSARSLVLKSVLNTTGQLPSGLKEVRIGIIHQINLKLGVKAR